VIHPATRTDGWLVAAALLRYMEREGLTRGATGPCGRTSTLWSAACSPEHAPSFLAAQQARLDSIVATWRPLTPARFPGGLIITGTTRRWHSWLLDRRNAVGFTAWRPQVAIIDTHEEDGEQMAAVLAHELGHQVDFRVRGPLKVSVGSRARAEAIADSVMAVILCEASPRRLRCTAPPYQPTQW
jgi:hypothetical protein